MMAELLLITGFLGSGKTTLLKELIEAFKTKKIGVVINEFGETGIDGRLISHENFDLVEINNGSVFCSCLKDKFIDALIEMTKYDLDYIFVESTGLADPSNMDSISEILSKQKMSKYKYKGSICIIDAEYFEDLFDLLPAIERQIVFSELIIINKADTRTQDELDEISKKIVNLNSKARLIITTFCKADYVALLEDLYSAAHTVGESINTPESRLKTVRLRVEENYTMTALNQFLKEICQYTYRIKGFIQVDGEVCEISVVNCTVNINKSDSQTSILELVLISSIGISILSRVAEMWNKYFDHTLQII